MIQKYAMLRKAVTIKKIYKEKSLFFRRFLASPGTVGSLTPSSAFLARAMFAQVDWENLGAIAELGAGTGVFTREIANNKKMCCKAAIFELDDIMRGRLERKYHDLAFYANACDLEQAAQDLGIERFDCIVSGLPFAVFPQKVRDCILDAVESTLKDGGLFVTFQYSLQMREQLRRRFGDVRLRFVPFNMPPAVVYNCRKGTLKKI